MEMQPTFTLTFSIGTSMREIHDTVIRTVLQYTRYNRLRAAQLLQINPRTIRRRLGKKDAGRFRHASGLISLFSYKYGSRLALPRGPPSHYPLTEPAPGS